MKVKALAMGSKAVVVIASHRINNTLSSSERGGVLVMKSPTALPKNRKITYPCTISSLGARISACSPCCSPMKCPTTKSNRTRTKS